MIAHLVRAWRRYRSVGGDRLAAALTMYAILSLLPLLLLATSVLGYVLAHDPDRQQQLFASISDALPGAGPQLGQALANVRETRAATGAFGLAGLVVSGLGGVGALRDALRIMWDLGPDPRGLLRRKASDAVAVVLVGVTLLVSFGVSALATGRAGAFGVGVGVDVALFLVLFTWLPRTRWPWRRFVRGAVFGGVAFGVLKLGAGLYVGQVATRSTALYGSIGTAVAVLVGLYLVSLIVLFTAAWTVTAPGWVGGSDDVRQNPAHDPRGGRYRIPRQGDRVGVASRRA